MKRLMILAVAVALLCAAASTVHAEPTKQYVTTTIKGVLTEPSGKKPMAGARFRFTPTNPANAVVETVTDNKGRFEARGLGFGDYAIEIQTADGQVIRGINEFPVTPGKTYEVELSLSERVDSTTALENQPDRFAVVTKVEPTRWKRFWKQFGIFAGVAVASGAAFF